MKRGWFTYTDLCVLLEQSAWSQALTAIYQHFTKVRRGPRWSISGVDVLLGGGACCHRKPQQPTTKLTNPQEVFMLLWGHNQILQNVVAQKVNIYACLHKYSIKTSSLKMYGIR